jgi:hypothetical protein
MATIPICGICGGRGWGHICAGNEPAWVKTILKDERIQSVPPIMSAGFPLAIARAVGGFQATGQVIRKATNHAPSLKPAEPVSGLAPQGQCAHCDAARVAAAERQLRHRNKRKGTQ